MGDEEGGKDIGRKEMVGWRLDNKGGWEVDATVFTCKWRQKGETCEGGGKHGKERARDRTGEECVRG